MELNKQEFGICNLSVVPLRAEPSDKSEMVSQLLFGDLYEVLQKEEKWIRIRMTYDAYDGWIDIKQHQDVVENTYLEISKSYEVLPLKIFNTIKQVFTDEKLYLLAGSSIPVLKEEEFMINDERYRFLGILEKMPLSDFSSKINACAKFYLNAPYLWGGRTIFGIDCSGFTQIVFKQFGIQLKRDAWQQAEQGQLVGFLSEAQAGDLAFFDNEESRVIHVGIMLNNSQIIHASGKVRVDSIDNEGIYNAELRRYTHKLRILKRFV